MPSQTQKPIAPSFTCVICSANTERSGPFWNLDFAIPGMNRPLVLCRSCTLTQTAPLELVPKDRLREALKDRRGLEEREHLRIQQLQAATKSIEQLELKLQDANDRAASSEANRRALEARLEASESQAVAARLDWDASVAALDAAPPADPVKDAVNAAKKRTTAKKPPARKPAPKAAA